MGWDQEELLAQWDAGATASTIVAATGVPKSSLYVILGRNGRRSSGQVRTSVTPLEERILAEYSSGMSGTEVGGKLGTSPKNVWAVLKRNAVKIRPIPDVHRKYTINEEAFSQGHPDTPYWVGVMLTDGNVYVSKRSGENSRVALSLNEKDEATVVGLAEFMGYNGPLRHDKLHRVTLQVFSQRMADDLAAWGVTPRKTFTTSAPPALQQNPLFWRGVIDGDGSVYVSSKGIGLSLTSASLGFAESFLTFCKSVTTSASRVYEVHGVGTYYRVSFSGNNAKNILRSLYAPQGPFMLRKKLKANPVLEVQDAMEQF